MSTCLGSVHPDTKIVCQFFVLSLTTVIIFLAPQSISKHSRIHEGGTRHILSRSLWKPSKSSSTFSGNPQGLPHYRKYYCYILPLCAAYFLFLLRSNITAVADYLQKTEVVPLSFSLSLSLPLLLIPNRPWKCKINLVP